MVLPILHPASLLAALSLCTCMAQNAEQNTAARAAALAIQRADFQTAEKILRTELQAHPNDPWTLSLLGVALDDQKKVPEAEEYHRKAVAASPHSAEILNNYGTHQWTAGQFDKAEISFASALAAAPGYFNVLFNLGTMASYAGHYERAQEVLEAALRQQPQDVDVLYRLAYVEEATKQWENAVMHLAHAAKLDPRRADVQKLLAVTTSELGALDDSAAAWDRYLELEPNDEAARRERGYTAARMGKLQQGTADLEWYVSRHPEDLVGQYELGQAERSVDMVQAMEHLNKALALDPNYVPARAARGGLYYQEGKPESALPDLEFVASKQPDDAPNLDRLGQTYQALDRPADSVRVLRRAAGLAPGNSTVVLHFARALADAGQTEESEAMMKRFRQLGPEENSGVPAGLVAYLSLTPSERRADYRSRAEKAVHDHPEDPAAELEYLKLVIEERDAKQVEAAAKRIGAMKPAATVLADAGRALLAGKYSALSRDLLQQAVATGSAAPAVELNLAVATFQATSAKAGLDLLDRVPESGRGADYDMARAQMLDAAGKLPEAASAIKEALHAAPDRPDLYRQALSLLVKRGKAADALGAIEEGSRALPDNREILLLKATTLEFAHRSEEAEHLLIDLQNRWPEWSGIWMAHGMILASHQHCEEARQALQTAVTLGAGNPEAYYSLADCTLRSGSAGKDAAEAAIREALKLAPEDAWVQALGGRIALERGEYELAAKRDREAIRLRPGLAEAHKSLATAYAALGRKQESTAELTTAAANTSKANEPPYLTRLFEGELPEAQSTHKQ